jgi:hypothetical protein
MKPPATTPAITHSFSKETHESIATAGPALGLVCGAALPTRPQQFRPVCERIREVTTPKQGDFLRGLDEGDSVTNPHDNAVAEKLLAADLFNLANLSSREPGRK